MRIGISIPTYNEVQNVELLINSIIDSVKYLNDDTFILLFIDDSSPDGTAQLIKNLSKSLKLRNIKIKLCERKEKNGLGNAYNFGFSILIKEQVDYVLQMDADLSHNPKYIPRFIELAKQNNDLIIASRYIKGGGTPDWSLQRKLQSRLGNLYAGYVLGVDITDYTGGFNMYNRRLLKKVLDLSVNSVGYGYLIELKYKAKILNKSKTIEFPIVFNDRAHGNSKIPKSTILKNLILVPKLKLYRFTKK